MDLNDLNAPTPDADPQETREWLDSLDAVIEREGAARANFLLEQLVARARGSGAYIPYNANTAYINTISPEREERSPGDAELEHRIRSLVRWNAMATVVRANKESSELGGHIASFASALAATQFRPQWPTLDQALRGVVGGVLLGWGAMTAIGCTVGTLMSGTMAGAASGWIFLVASFAGVYVALRLGKRLRPVTA